jgi:hypothetical protein
MSDRYDIIMLKICLGLVLAAGVIAGYFYLTL